MKNLTDRPARLRALAVMFWLSLAAGPAFTGALRAADPADWRVNSRNGVVTKTVLLHSPVADGRVASASPVEVRFPDGYRYCHHHLNYRGWVGRGIATVVGAAPDRMVFGISVIGGNGPLDQGQGSIAVTVVGIAANRSSGACEALPVIGDDVSVDIQAWVFDETEHREVQGSSAYPDPGFSDDPARPDRVNGRWHGGYHWKGNSLCLEIRNLTAPDPPDHLLSIGYAVTLKGARFSDADSSKNLKLYSYRGVPDQSEITQCFPVRR